MNIKAILESKLDSEKLVKLGEANLAKLSEITIEDDVADDLKSALLSLTEAENSPSIVSKNKDKWHKEAKKAFMDSIDSTLADHLELLGDTVPTETKDKSKGIVTAYKAKVESLNQELESLKLKVKDGVSDADSKALIQAKELEILELKKTHVPSDTIKAIKDENEVIKKELESFKRASIKEKITNSAIKSGILIDLNPEIVDEVVNSSVKKYLERVTFGNDASKAKILIDKVTKQVVVRNAADETMSIVSNGKILTIDDITKDALIEFDLNKKSDNPNPVPFNPPVNPQQKTQLLNDKYF